MLTELDLRTHIEPLYHPQLVRMPRLRTPAQCGTPSGQHRRGVLREVVKVRQGIFEVQGDYPFMSTFSESREKCDKP